MKWIAGNNRPGVLPDYEPQQFETWDQAVDHTIDELAVQFATVPMKSGVIPAYHDTLDALVSFSPPGQPTTVYYEGRIYWIADLP